MRRLLIAAALATLPLATPVAAQEDDKGYLATLLEENLSGAGRKVTVDGFAGALSSRAVIRQLTIADDQGVWLTLNGVTLDWSRSALLLGEVSVNELTADEIIVARKPQSETETPAPEAGGFSLPDLPVSITIGKLAAGRIELGPDILGESFAASLDASLVLAGGEGVVDARLTRVDGGPAARIAVQGSYANASRNLVLDLSASEAAGGIAARMIGLPGTPATDLTIKGTGPIDDFTATLRLATDGQDRLAGTVAVKGQSFSADVAGDVAPLFLPEYAEFFGPDVALKAVGQQLPTGGVSLSDFDLSARSLSLNGAVELAPDGLPRRFDVTGRIADPNGARVLLPTPDRMELDRADLSLAYDAATDEGWRGSVMVTGLERDDFDADRLELSGSGRIARPADLATFTASLVFDATGLSPADPALAKALGPTVSGRVLISAQQGADALRLPALSLQGDGFRLTGAAEVAGLSDAFRLSGRVAAEVADLSRLADLTGQPLAGSAALRADGNGSLGGDFDLRADVTGQDLRIGIPQADRLLAGGSSLRIDASRDSNGTTLRMLDVQAGPLTASASGTLTSTANDLTARIDLTDLSRLDPAWGGGVNGTVALKGTGPLGTAFNVKADVAGQDLRIGQEQADRLLAGASSVTLDVSRDAAGGITLHGLDVTAGPLRTTASGSLIDAASVLAARIDLSDLSRLDPRWRGVVGADVTITGSPDSARITLDGTTDGLSLGQAEADKLLAGRSALSVALRLTDGTLELERADLKSPQITASAKGLVTEAERQVELTAQLANLGLFVPEFPGAVRLSGTAVERGQGYELNLTTQGPGGIDARVAGNLSAAFDRADLTVKGRALAALANPFLSGRLLSGPLAFDLRLNGPLALSSLSGTIGLTGGRIADPGVMMALQDLNATIRLAGARATVTADSRLSTSGGLGVSGTVGLEPPFAAALEVAIRDALLRDPNLFQTTANGTLRVTGPLTGGATIAGRIALSETEVQIPSTGLGGAADLPGLTHRAEPAEVRATRARAGMLEPSATASDGGSARPFALDITVSAPSRLFIRGRGLDAELGGSLTLRGTTAAVVPNGAFNLLRGRLDILGRRLTLTEASLAMEGDLIPTVGIAASTEIEGVTATVRIDGPATDPKVSFTSAPELPEEEVLARLLFGRDLTTLSPLQAAQLANAVSTLAGRGGQGMVGRLRQGFGLDDLDLRTDDSGGAAVTAGKYLAKNVYTEVVVGSEGKSEIHLNLDVNDSVTVRGRASNDGTTGLGVFFEKDY